MPNKFNVTIIDTIDQVHEINFKHHEYRNLMELIVDNYYEEIGECRGRGMCRTCFVTIDEKSNIDKKRAHKISFINSPHTMEYLFACQILVDENINNMTFKVLGNN